MSIATDLAETFRKQRALLYRVPDGRLYKETKHLLDSLPRGHRDRALKTLSSLSQPTLFEVLHQACAVEEADGVKVLDLMEGLHEECCAKAAALLRLLPIDYNTALLDQLAGRSVEVRTETVNRLHDLSAEYYGEVTKVLHSLPAEAQTASA